MKRYLEHMSSKDPHERRTHALHVAGGVTALVFAVWVGTLGMRLSPDTTAVEGEANTNQAASVVQTRERSGPALEVSTSSVFLPQYNQ